MTPTPPPTTSTTSTTSSPLDQALEVQRIDGLGVPAFWVPGNGDSAAGLVFHTGRGVEPAALAGITHLIRHLTTTALGAAAHGPFDPPGVDVTGFSHRGSPDDVAAFLHALSGKLSVVPLELLDSAREEVRDESADWMPGPIEQLFRLRHGTLGLGALSFEEFGLRKAGHIQINAWAQRYLHSGNAAMWLAGPMPDGLRLRLVRGVPAEVDPHVLEIPTPGAAYGSEGHVALSLVAPRSHAIAAATKIIEARASYELCANRQISREVIVSLQRLDASRVEVVILADALSNRDDEVARVLLWVLDCLAYAEPSSEELNRYRDSVAWRYHDPHGAAPLALAHAVGHVTGAKEKSWLEVRDELLALTPSDVSRSLHDATPTMLILASRECGVLNERFQYVGDWSPSPVAGARVRPIKLEGERKVDRELWVGPQGVTIREGERVASVRFSECVLMLRDDGSYRELISENGGRVVILAHAWERGSLVVEGVDREITPERTIILDPDKDRKMGYIGAERRRWAR